MFIRIKQDAEFYRKNFDAPGGEVKTLVDSFQRAGLYSVVWDGNDNSKIQVSSGIYFYSLLTERINLQKKMV